MRANKMSLYFLSASSLLVFFGTLTFAGFFSPADAPMNSASATPQISSNDLAQSPAAAPEAIRQFVDTEVLQEVDLAAAIPRITEGDRFDNVSPALRIQAMLSARSTIRQLRPDATKILVVDQSGKTVEELPP